MRQLAVLDACSPGPPLIDGRISQLNA